MVHRKHLAMYFLTPDSECWIVSINLIGGIFEHSIACTMTVEMMRDLPIPLHPDVCAYALTLLQDCIPLMQLQHLAKKFAISKWGDEMGTSSFRYRLTTHDSTSLYWTIARTNGIYQQTTAKENLHNWFHSDKPSPPGSLLSDAVLYYEL
jgi:hypothetical protein